MSDNKIPLYDYQERISDSIFKDILERQVKIVNERLIIHLHIPIIRLISPLGSGKTRIITRVIDLLYKDSRKKISKKEVTIDGITNIIEKKIPGKIIIIVPVSIISQWESELDLWKINYKSIKAPKDLKLLEDDLDNIYLISDLRIKDVYKQYPNFINDSHFFMDEFDTIKTSPIKNIRENVTTLTIISASINRVIFPSTYTPIVYEHICDQKEVDDIIKLPDIIETKISYTLGLSLKQLLPYVVESISDKIKIGDYKTIFDTYKVIITRLDLLIKALIEENKVKISEHLKLHIQHQIPSFLARVKRANIELERILAKDWATPDLANCGQCFEITRESNLKNDICISCSGGLNVSSRIGVLDKILKSVELRPGRSKKILIYCSTDSLVAQLMEHLEKTNKWTLILKGSSVARTKIINKYKQLDQDIYMICNSVENSAGIHLPETTDIILYHKMESHFDIQIVGRGQRVGRTDNMYLHRIENLVN